MRSALLPLLLSSLAQPLRLRTTLLMRRASLLPCTDEGIEAAARALREGRLVAFPTETVYGLGAHALDPDAVLRIFEAKRRPLSDPVIVHVPPEDLRLDELFALEESPNARMLITALAEDFWPGPLTLVFRAGSRVPDCVTASTGFVGVRCPRHPVAQRLLRAARVPVAAPSANRFGHVSPTSSDHVIDDLGDETVAVLEDSDADGCSVGIESTVCKVSPSGDELRVLRCGAVTAEHLETALSLRAILCRVIVDNERVPSSTRGEQAVAPGQMIRHYAPDIPTYVYTSDTGDVSPDFVFRPAATLPLSEAVVIDFGGRMVHFKDLCGSRYADLSPSGDAGEACRHVFRMLRAAEDQKRANDNLRIVLLLDLRLAAREDQVVRALWERLNRAASGCFIGANSVTTD